MDFSAWTENYSRLYMVKVFPESWEIYSIDSEWEGKSYGGCSYFLYYIFIIQQGVLKEIWNKKKPKWKKD